jgi:hypothetical protein
VSENAPKYIFGHPVKKSAVDLRPALYGNWTTNPPKQEGFYWVRFADNRITVVEVEKWHDGGMRFTEIGSDEVPKVDDDWSPTHWLGPLPVPEPPKGE